MIVDDIDLSTVRSAVELACHAPSVHNSQPWRWLLGRRSVHLYADMHRWLPVTDHDGRDLLMSCGAVLHHLRVALAASGISATVHRTPNPADPGHLAALELHTSIPADADIRLAAMITRRRTDRRRFGDWEVPEAFVDALADRAARQGALLRPIQDPHHRDLLVAAMREADHAQEALPGYRTETLVWTGHRGVDDGIPAANLLRDSARATARRFPRGEVEQRTGGADGALLCVLDTTSDDTLAQLRAGEALSAVLLHATELGLATCPLSQPFEIEATRIAVQDDVLGGTASPQIVVRLGWAPVTAPPPPTPRRALGDVVGRMPG